MDGIHDLGGMHGFGPVERDDAQFHEDWERVALALSKLLQAQGLFTVDEKRHAVERIPPERYLADTYFERWLDSLELLIEEHGVASAEEIQAELDRVLDGDEAVPERTDAELAASIRESFEGPHLKGHAAEDPAFAPGDAVIVKNQHPQGHTRVPRYARRSRGTVDQVFGTFPLPDAVVHGDGHAEPVYKVRFSARELWGDEYPETDSVTLDLWESYLELA